MGCIKKIEGKHMIFTALYLTCIVAVNFAFSMLPMIELPFNQNIPIGTFLVGFIFVLRDYAQREIGNWIYLAMIAGVLVSYFMADPFVAVASAIAFGLSELVDAIVFTYTKKSMRDRILLSSAVSTPVDSAVFLLMLGFFNWLGFIIMIAVKMIGALIVWRALK
jgi:queuosine precursor transporter